MKETDRIKINFLKWLIDRSTGYAIPNYYLRSAWECDVLVLSKNNFLTEYEIKTSVADFKKDFQKGKRYAHYFSNGRLKHHTISNGERTNRFFFVVPTGLLDISQIPDYAGLIEVGERWRDVEQVKNAKWLHKNKVDNRIYKDILDKFYLRYVNKVFYPEFYKIKERIEKTTT